MEDRNAPNIVPAVFPTVLRARDGFGVAGVNVEFRPDPGTGFLPAPVLLTPQGIEYLNIRLGHPDSVTLTFADQNGLSGLNRFGFAQSADIYNATIGSDFVGALGVRYAGDEFVFLTRGDGGSDVMHAANLAIEESRKGVLYEYLTLPSRFRMELLAHYDPTKLDVFDSEIDNLLKFRMDLAQEFVNWKTGTRALRQHYSDVAGKEATTEGFSRFLNEQYLDGRYSEDQLRTMSTSSLMKQALEQYPALRNGPAIGSFESVMVHIPGALTVENVRQAIAQAEKLLHRLKKDAANPDLRRELSALHELDPAIRLREADKTEVALVKGREAERKAIEVALSKTELDGAKRELQRELIKINNEDPALPGVLRASRLNEESLAIVAPWRRIDVATIDIPGFQVLNNNLGYSRADEMMRAIFCDEESLVRRILPADTAILTRVAGGKIAIISESGMVSEEHLEIITAEIARSLENSLYHLDPHVKAKIEMELAERTMLNDVCREMAARIGKRVEASFGDFPAIVEGLQKIHHFTRPESEFPGVEVEVRERLDPEVVKFKDL